MKENNLYVIYNSQYMKAGPLMSIQIRKTVIKLQLQKMSGGLVINLTV